MASSRSLFLDASPQHFTCWHVSGKICLSSVPPKATPYCHTLAELSVQVYTHGKFIGTQCGIHNVKAGEMMGELTLPFTICSTQESGPCTLPGQHSRVDSIDSGAGGRAGPKVIRAGELPLSLTSCSIEENGPYPSSGRHSRADPDGVGVGLYAEEESERL
ncbi:histone deacetylase complex subunit SAP30L-like protein [Cricetulus griseus]|nr:histone deacetylase complex subunit SAP30L-like protein [Cricetulus griseus]